MPEPGDPGPPAPSPGPGEPDFASLADAFLARRRAGEDVSVEAMAAAHPALAADIRGLFPTLLAMERAGASGAVDRIGPYRVLRELGRGGMGIVHLAEDTRLPRRVALKVLSPGFAASPDILLRFRREAEIASRLDHPSICTVYDAGESDGVAWIAMRYVEGETLAQWIEARRAAGRPADRADVAAVLRWAEETARALHAAHESGLIHRDVKPGNIMIDRDGHAVVLDFGLARAEERTDGAALTQTGAMVGTPAYMSPEQILAERFRLDRRTDVYSLGVTLYEALTLRLPFHAATHGQLLQAILASQPDSPRRHNPTIGDDLRVVVETAMDRERDRRYRTAAELADDLRRVRSREPIRARPAGPWIRARRWAERNPVLATSAAGLVATLAVGLGVALHLLHVVSGERDARDDALRRLHAATDAQDRALVRAEGLRLTAQSSAVLARDPGLALLLAIEGARREPGRLADEALVDALAACRERRTLDRGTGAAAQLGFAGDGRTLAESWERGSVRLVDAATGAVVGESRAAGPRAFLATLGRLGPRFLVAGRDGVVRVCDTGTGAEIAAYRGHTAIVRWAAFDAAGRRVASCAEDGSVHVWGAATGEPIAVARTPCAIVRWVEFTAGGSAVLACCQDGVARLVDAATGALRTTFDVGGGLWQSRVDPSGTRVVFAADGTLAAVWDLATARPLVSLAAPDAGIRTVCWSPDGTLVFASARNGTGLVFDAASGREVARMHGHSAALTLASFDAAGRRVLTSSIDRTARLFDVSTGEELARFGGHSDQVRMAVFSPDETTVATASLDGTVRLWDPAQATGVVCVPGGGEVCMLRWSPDGRHVAAAGRSEDVRVLRPDDGRPVRTFTDEGIRARAVAWNSDGTRLAAGAGDGSVRVWDAADGKAIVAVRRHAAAVTGIAFLPGDDVVASSSGDGTVRTWDVRDGAERAVVLRGSARVLSIAVAATGLLAAACDDGTLTLADARTCAVRGVVRGLTDSERVRFSRDGARVVCAAERPSGRGISVVDVASLRVISRLGDPGDRWFEADPSPDGSLIAAGDGSGAVTFLDAATGAVRRVMRGHGDLAVTVEFSPDGRLVASGSRDGTVRIWPVDALAEAEARRPREFTDAERALYLSTPGVSPGPR